MGYKDLLVGVVSNKLLSGRLATPEEKTKTGATGGVVCLVAGNATKEDD